MKHQPQEKNFIVILFLILLQKEHLLYDLLIDLINNRKYRENF